jgi:hypothetical protein
MKNETKILLVALRNFLARPEVKNKKLVATMPVDPRLGDMSGKAVDVPLESVLQGLLHKLSFKDMTKTLDENNDVVAVFLSELYKSFKKYYVPDKSVIGNIDKEKHVDALADNIIDGEFNESE